MRSQQIEAAMNKALALDDALAEAYNTKAGVSISYYRDWPTAERAFKRSIALNPNFAEAHRHYAVCLVGFGRSEPALRPAVRRFGGVDGLRAVADSSL